MASVGARQVLPFWGDVPSATLEAIQRRLQDEVATVRAKITELKLQYAIVDWFERRAQWRSFIVRLEVMDEQLELHLVDEHFHLLGNAMVAYRMYMAARAAGQFRDPFEYEFHIKLMQERFLALDEFYVKLAAFYKLEREKREKRAMLIRCKMVYDTIAFTTDLHTTPIAPQSQSNDDDDDGEGIVM